MKNIFNKYSIIISVVIIIILIGLKPYLYLTSKFTKTITITQKDIGLSRRINYMIVDENNNVYYLTDLWFKGDFSSRLDYSKIHIGNKYIISGFGYPKPMLGMYVYEIKQI